ncbi:MAG: hypothetical protein HRT66_03380 [Flavobacteriaceae bacterium]|nr:hypothetical protein [Flavobacteriaceae bacterium]
MKKIILTTLILGVVCSLLGQERKQKEYSFIISDGIKMFTMTQSNENYLSSYRLIGNSLHDSFGHSRLYSYTMFAVTILGVPYTHERGHMSVLNHLRIGSINQPIMNERGAAYVNGVTNETLINIEKNNNKYYIRLHTSGIESDYVLVNKMSDLMFFEEESSETFFFEYLMRKLSNSVYISQSLYPSISPELKEEENELDRDIVGHDVWGAIHNLHNPEAEFKRYNNWSDLTSEEKSYGKKNSLAFFS